MENTALTEQERGQMLAWLEESRQGFLAAIAAVTPAQWEWRPEPGRWTIGESVEHIVLGEALLFEMVKRSLAAPANPDWEERTKGKTELVTHVLPGKGKAVAPDPLVPKGGLTPEEAIRRFDSQRIGIVAFTNETAAPLKEHTAEHPFPFFSTLNAHQWLIYIPLHTIRHTRQIQALKSAAGYPTGE